MGTSIFEVERQDNGDIIVRFKPPMLMGLSENTKQHILSAQREALLAVRSVLDGAIEKTEEIQGAKVKKERTKINVE